MKDTDPFAMLVAVATGAAPAPPTGAPGRVHLSDDGDPKRGRPRNRVRRCAGCSRLTLRGVCELCRTTWRNDK